MEDAERELQFKQALVHFHETGRLHPSDLQLPIMRGSPPTYMWFIPGYEGGAYDPERLGVACIVVPPLEAVSYTHLTLPTN